MLIKYVRKPKVEISIHNQTFRNTHEPIGIIVADLIDGEIRVGWSKCCPKDKFDKEKGLSIAKARLNKCHVFPTRDMLEPIQFMIKRASKYFKCSI